MKVVVVRGVFAGGSPRGIGEILELAAGEALQLIGQQSVERYIEPAPVVPELVAETISAPVVEPVAVEPEKTAPAAKKEKSK